jgi:hypothetical protein
MFLILTVQLIEFAAIYFDLFGQQDLSGSDVLTEVFSNLPIHNHDIASKRGEYRDEVVIKIPNSFIIELSKSFGYFGKNFVIFFFGIFQFLLVLN